MRHIGIALVFVGFVIAGIGMSKYWPDKDERKLDLMVDDVSVGVVRAGVQTPIVVRLTNRTSRIIVLNPPVTDCGCLQAIKGSLSVPANQSLDVGFTLRTPGMPQAFNRRITFSDSQHSTRKWTCAVGGEVVEQIWAQPTALEIEYQKSQGVVQASFDVHRLKGNDPLSIELEEDKENAKVSFTSKERDDCIQVTFTVDSHRFPQGISAFRISDQSKQRVVRVPIEWHAVPAVTYFPESLSLDMTSQSKTIVVNFGPEISKDSVRVTADVPWCKIARIELRDSGGVLVVEFDLARATRPFNGTLFTLHSDIGPPFPFFASLK